MKYNIITYLIAEGLKNIFKNKKMMFASLTIMCAAMIIFGIFFAIGENINFAMKKIEGEQGIRVFIDNISEEDTRKLEQQIKSINGVNTVQFISKEEAFETKKEQLKTNASVLDGYEEAFPASFFVTLSDLNLSKEVQEEIKKFENIDEVASKDDVVQAIIGIGKSIRIVTGIISAFLVVFSVFIISNTIKLAVHSRRKEISIMKYVGATNNFIRSPFIVEGIILGIIAALISVALVGVVYNVGAAKLVTTSITYVNLTPLHFSDMFNLIITVYMVLGVGVGILGSMMSMKKYLDV